MGNGALYMKGEENKDVRYWRGKTKCFIIEKHGKKAIIEYLENGLVGNNREGKKFVLIGDRDITLIRHCWRNEK